MRTDPRGAGRSRSERLRYRFDLLLARGTWVALLWLGAVTFAAVVASTLLLAAFDVTLEGSQDGSMLEDFWQSTLRVLDPGTMAADVGWGRRLLALVITIVGLLIAGTLIGLIASGVEQRVERMRGGRSAVIESGHVVILGASSRLPAVVQQLLLANAKRRRNAVVVLTDRNPTQIGDEVRTVVGNPRGSRLVFRRGDPTRQSDLGTIALHDARTIIVLADDESAADSAESDARVVAAVLAAGAELGGFDRVPIIAELGDAATAASLQRACGATVHPVVAAHSVSRSVAIALREPGLNQVFEELLDFEGSDLYLSDASGVLGMPFQDIVFRYANARPIGRMRANGNVEINPDPDTVFAESDRLVVIADSDVDLEVNTVEFQDRDGPVDPRARPFLGAGPREQHVLVVGWNTLGAELIQQWEQFAVPGSTIEIVYDASRFDADELNIDAMSGLNVTLTPSPHSIWQFTDITDVAELTTVVLLGNRQATSAPETDSHTLLNLMLLRRALDESDSPAPKVVVELRELDSVALARRAGADDCVMSEAIGSRLIAQLAEQPERRSVFLSLYTDGPSVHLVDALELGLAGTVTGADIVAAAYAVGVVAIGWRRPTVLGGELGLNPHVTERVHLGADDQIVIVG